MEHTIQLPKLEIRSKDGTGKPTYIVRGYAAVPNHVYTYKTKGNRAFKEYFTEKGIENIKRKLKSQKVFVDVEHSIATASSSEHILNEIKKKTGQDFTEEINYIKQRVINSDLPMFKFHDLILDDNGLLLELRGNPYYRDVDIEHQRHFDATWGSLETGFLNGMSFNFKPSDIVQVNDELTQINDVDIFGISLTGGAANELPLTEVLMRSIENCRGEEKWQKKKVSLMML